MRAGRLPTGLPIGLYIHVPFCASKCPYCDFYSLTGQKDDKLDAYTHAVCRTLEQWGDKGEETADTLYFGGGTPSLLGPERLTRIINTAKRTFSLHDAEITMEANPGQALDETFAAFAAAGGNRLSLGMQAATEEELSFLGREHRPSDVAAAVKAAKAAGIDNISLDWMLGLPTLSEQNTTSVVQAATDALKWGVRHISAYLLKVEEGTPFYQRRESLSLPDEEETVHRYLAVCETLTRLGYSQYEISNFAVPGYESRHNLKYWNADPYLGIGPSAHSFLGGERFYYPPDLEAFLQGDSPVRDEEEGELANGGEQEYLMLRLRLTEGVTEKEFSARFGHPIPTWVRENASHLPPRLVTADKAGIRLTREGFLLSNPLISRLLGWE